MILPWLILIPFIGGLLCWQGERFGHVLPRWIALITMGLLFGLSLWLWVSGDFTWHRPRTAARAGPTSSSSTGSRAWVSPSTWRWTACRC